MFVMSVALFVWRALLDENAGRRHRFVSKARAIKLVQATTREAMVNAVLAKFDAALTASWHRRVVGTQVTGKILFVIAVGAA